MIIRHTTTMVQLCPDPVCLSTDALAPWACLQPVLGPVDQAAGKWQKLPAGRAWLAGDFIVAPEPKHSRGRASAKG